MRSHTQFRFSIVILALFGLLVACQSSRPTQYVVEVTKEVTVVVFVTPTPGGISPTTTIQAESTSPDATAPTLTTIISPTSVITPTLDPFPTPINEQIIVSEELFEHGRMFWLQPNRQIWVMIYGDDTNSGRWMIRNDIFIDGMLESAPDITPPATGLYQPIRGFGKLWREDQEIRDLLGWATDSEYGHVTTYQYFAGGTVTPDGVYIPGPGYHTLRSRYGGTYTFDEASWTWQRTPES